MNILYNISGTIAFVLFLVKLLIHINIDRRNDYEIKVGVFSSIQYFLIYNKVVNSEDLKRKKICNYIYRSAILFFVLSLIVLLFLNLLNPVSSSK